MRPPRWRLGRWYLGLEFVPSAWCVGVTVNTRLVGTMVTVYPLPTLRLIAYRTPA